MPLNTNGSTVNQIQDALNAGDIGAVRSHLFDLSEEEQIKLKDEIGAQDFDKVYSSARKIQRGKKKGRVIFLHGIMGSMLDVEKKDGVDLIWTSYWKLFNGRVGDFELKPNGDPAPGDVVQVRTSGQNRKYYLPMLLELDREWEVRPFAYDWREDIVKSAHRLAAEIKSFGNGEPVHLVAHSMGGLVSRCFIKLYPDLWDSMEDKAGLKKGGRLVMLGTPNLGAHAIQLALSGGEKLVRMLAILDRKHDLQELLTILNTFPGSYQMLPSQLLDLPDDHKKLYDSSNWGSVPVHQPLLDNAAKFHSSLASVIFPDRFIYVAGYDQKTPNRIKIKAAGEFEYKYTQEGDGRVPHELGLLPDVDTYWIKELHGDLARNSDVLKDIHGILENGKTKSLETVRPALRAAVVEADWQSAEELEHIPKEFQPLLANETRAVRPKKSLIEYGQQQDVESLILADYLGRKRGWQAIKTLQNVERTNIAGTRKLNVKVVWGGITSVEGDVFCVGHYQGVQPQNAEFLLDLRISKADPKESEKHVLRNQTIRGMLKGELGDVDFFPWNEKNQPPRSVAIAGMGRPGVFTSDQLRILSGKLALAIGDLPQAETVCTVVIGSGKGTMSVKEAARVIVQGFVETFNRGEAGHIQNLHIVEIYRHRADEILEELKELQKTANDGNGKTVFELATEKEESNSGKIAAEDALEQILHSAIDAYGSGAGKKNLNAANTLLTLATKDKAALRKRVLVALKESFSEVKAEDRNEYIVGRRSDVGDSKGTPTRISFVLEGETLRVSAISESTTVSERILRFDQGLVREVVDLVNNAELEPGFDVSDYLTRLLLPAEFQDLLSCSEIVIFEVDRRMSQVHWEMLSKNIDDAEKKPIGVASRVSRQLRTTYSPAPILGRGQSQILRALVVGDPGDPSRRHNLPGALEEALAVKEFLEGLEGLEGKRKVEVVARIGAPTVPRTGKLRDIKPASRSDVLHLLMRGGFDILHYAGHGDFDPVNPERTGWLFASGLLTALELERIEMAPGVVVANACLSSRTSSVSAVDTANTDRPPESMLLPSLADEFFRRGVRNYIGTAWEVNDIGAILFAKEFYKELLRNGASFGDAVFQARNALYKKQGLYGNLWAAYQHYGDPTSSLSE